MLTVFSIQMDSLGASAFLEISWIIHCLCWSSKIEAHWLTQKNQYENKNQNRSFKRRWSQNPSMKKMIRIEWNWSENKWVNVFEFQKWSKKLFLIELQMWTWIKEWPLDGCFMVVIRCKRPDSKKSVGRKHSQIGWILITQNKIKNKKLSSVRGFNNKKKLYSSNEKLPLRTLNGKSLY